MTSSIIRVSTLLGLVLQLGTAVDLPAAVEKAAPKPETHCLRQAVTSATLRADLRARFFLAPSADSGKPELRPALLRQQDNEISLPRRVTASTCRQLASLKLALAPLRPTASSESGSSSRLAALVVEGKSGSLGLPVFGGLLAADEPVARTGVANHGYELRRSLPPGMRIERGEALIVAGLDSANRIDFLELKILEDVEVSVDGVTSVWWRPGGPDGWWRGTTCVLDASDPGSCNRLAQSCGYTACAPLQAIGGLFGGCAGLLCECKTPDGKTVEHSLDMQELGGSDIDCDRKDDGPEVPTPPAETQTPG